MKFYVIAGEPSGDRLGASLIKGFDSILSAQVNFCGIGGPLMMDMGLESLFPMEDISIMGIGEILTKYRFLKKRIAQTAKAVIIAQPDALITIALAKDGKALLGITGSYAGQLFGLLVGFGTAMLKKSLKEG